MTEIPRDWYDGFFDTSEWLEQVVPRITAERTQQEVDFIVEKLALEPGEHVLDLACGHGRISLELARRGYRVTGLDLSARSLELARRAADEEGLDVEWVRGDMREPPPGPLDAVVNMYTAFGYFEEEAEDQRVLDAVAAALRPGGRFLIEIINPLGLARVYRDRTWDTTPDGTLHLQEHSYDFLRGRNSAVWTFIHADGTRGELVHSLRMYAPHELAAMIAAAGLEIFGAWGGTDGGELSFERTRTILAARKA